MSSGGKSGSAASESKNVYGSGAVAFCWGPLDWLRAVIHNGNYLWQGDLSLTSDVHDLTGSIIDPSYIAAGGFLKLYRGTETQPASTIQPNAPRDKGTVKLEFAHLLFGQDTGTAPNLQLIGGRVPRVPGTVVAAEHNVADDDQVNPIAAWAEVLLDERGAGFDPARLDLPSWLAAGEWAYNHRADVFCSPLLAEQSALREIARRLLDPFNGFCRWTTDGKLACVVYEWGVDPGGLPILDARHWNKRPKLPLGDWNDVPTELLVKFTDRDYEFQDNTVLVPNARAAQIRQVDDQRKLDRPDYTRINQAQRNAVEWNRRLGTAPSRATISVTAPFIADKNVGDKIKIDTDPEPGGAGLAQHVRIERIEQDASDDAQIEVMTDNLVPATAYSPDWTPATPVEETCPPLEHFLGVPLPPNVFGWPPSVALLATRPTRKVIGFEAYFGASHAGSFAALGQQAGFSVRASLHADVTSGATTLAFTETDTVNGPDASLAAATPGGNTAEAENNVLLALLATLDGNGRIALGADGDPLMEFVSIVQRATAGGLSADTFNYTVLRARLGTKAQAWTAAATAVWIVPHVNLTAWRHTLLSSMLGGVAYFRLVAFTAGATDETTPIPELSVNMLPATAPMYGGTIDGTTGPDDGVAPNPVSGVTVTPGLNVLVLRWSNPSNVPLKRIFIYEAATSSQPLSPSFAIDAAQTFHFRTGLANNETKYFWIEVQAVNGRRALAGPFSGTTRGGVDLSDIVPGMEMVGIVSALPSPVGYTGPKNVLLTTDKKLYRYDASVPAWTNEVDGADLRLNSVVVGALAAGAVTAYAVGTNLIVTSTANIGTAVVNDGAIISLTAGKLTAGDLSAMTLLAAKTATDSEYFNTADRARTMPATSFQQAEDPTHVTGLSSTPLERSMVTFEGWLGGSTGYSEGRFGKSTMRFLCCHNGGCTVATGQWIDLKISYRINGGGWVDVTPFVARALDSNGVLNISGGCVIGGLVGTDVIEFGVRVNAADNASQLNVTNLSVAAFNS